MSRTPKTPAENHPTGDRRDEDAALSAPRGSSGPKLPHGTRRGGQAAAATPGERGARRVNERARESLAEGERWFGTQQAARFLNVHRSTVNLAIKRNNLIADYITPGGHHRFKTSTLEAFRETLRTDSATNVERAAEPVRLLGAIAHELMATGDLTTICAETIAGIRRTEHDIDMVTIIRLCRDPYLAASDPGHARIESLAAAGFPDAARAAFLRFRDEDKDMLSSRALHAGTPIILNDLTEDTLPYASREILRHAEIRSFAVLPITAPGRTYGALNVGSRKPGIFTPSLVAYLDTIVRQLALTMRSDEYLSISRELMVIAVRLCADTAASDAAPAEHAPCMAEAREHILSSRLGDLTRVFTSYTGAHRTWGYNLPGVPTPKRGEQKLAKLGREVCKNIIAHPNRAVQYTIDGRPHTALATSFEITPAQHGVVGAVWHGNHQASAGDYALLMTYGASCLLATAPSPLGEDDARP